MLQTVLAMGTFDKELTRGEPGALRALLAPDGPSTHTPKRSCREAPLEGAGSPWKALLGREWPLSMTQFGQFS